MFFFPAVLDTNGKITTFFVLPILQKSKCEGFFHHKGFLKEILSLRYRVFVKLRSNRYKIILFDFHLLQKRYMDHFESQLCDQTEFGKKVEISDHFTASHKIFCFPFFSCFFKGPIEISSLNVAFALLLR